MENFNLDTVKNLSQVEAKAYVTKFFVPLTDGNHAMLKDGKYVIKDDTEIKKTYFNRMSKELQKYYFTEFTQIKTVVYELKKPRFYDDKINLCPSMKHTYNADYKPDAKTKQSLDFLLNYYLEVVCSSNKDCYEFLLKWIANMVRGNKNKSCLYLKGIQGIGKSTISEHLMKHVVGDPLSLETGSDPIKTKFNEILGGKLLVSIEELENFGKSEWEAMSSTLKRMISSNRISLQNKGTKAYETENINNYILASNNDAIKDDEGRRYYIVDISTHRLEDAEFFNKLYNDCFNDSVGEALFQFLHTIDLEGYDSQKYPITQNKLDSISKRLDSVYDFLKTKYIFPKQPINSKVNDLYEQYKLHCVYKKPYLKQDFNKKMEEINIKYYKSDGYNIYKISYENLLEIANKRRWIHKLDEFDDNNDATSVCAVEEVDEINIIKTLEDENKLLKIQLEEYKKLHVDYIPIIIEEKSIIIEEKAIIIEEPIVNEVFKRQIEEIQKNPKIFKKDKKLSVQSQLLKEEDDKQKQDIKASKLKSIKPKIKESKLNDTDMNTIDKFFNL